MMFKKNLITVFIICLLANAVTSTFVGYKEFKETHFKELEKLLGKTVLICTGTNSKKFYLSTFERLDKEQKQKLKKQIDIAYSNHTTSDSKYINDVYSAYIALLHNGAIKPYNINSNEKGLESFYKSSRAPPSHS